MATINRSHAMFKIFQYSLIENNQVKLNFVKKTKSFNAAFNHMKRMAKHTMAGALYTGIVIVNENLKTVAACKY